MSTPKKEWKGVKETYGFLPTSVWNLRKGRWKDIGLGDFGDPRGKTKTSAKHDYFPNLTFSKFNPAVAERIVKFWSEEGETVVDPFSGRTTRGGVTIFLKRHYIGYEIAPKTHAVTLEQLKRISPPVFDTLGPYDVHLGDGCLLKHSEDESADLIFTCPPYHDLEKYESTPGQLSDIKSYDGFLDQIRECAKNCFRVLKPDRHLVWVIADWRKKGKYYDFSGDSVDIFKEAGFTLWDRIINVLDSVRMVVQMNYCGRYKVTAKQHEYILVFKKVG